MFYTHEVNNHFKSALGITLILLTLPLLSIVSSWYEEVPELEEIEEKMLTSSSPSVLEISAGTTHTCAILDYGMISCWGDNAQGQLGDGTNTDSNTPIQTFSLETGRTAVTISAGYRHVCAILDDGSVSCWGWNDYGQLGDGTTTAQNTPTQTSSLGEGRTAVVISTAQYHTCAILDDGSVSCWGKNTNGQLGDGTTIDRNTPTQTSSLGEGRTAVALDVGSFHTCAILDDGSVSCWGENAQGQLGDGTNNGQNIPTQTSSLGINRTAVAITSGHRYTCIILDEGSVSCWGFNSWGQLGDGTNVDRNTPTQTFSLGTDRTAVAITAGWAHTCAILDDGSVSCWGHNDNGQLGDGTTTARNTPTQTYSLGSGRIAITITAGLNHACAILDDGSISCWGNNYYGQLGDGTNTDRNTPTSISFPEIYFTFERQAVKISVGESHTCAVLDNGSVSCWGLGSSGQLGTGYLGWGNPSQTSSFGTDRTAVAISAGDYHTCVILDNGSVSCWGANGGGQGGDGTTTNQHTPTLTVSLGASRTAVAISAGDIQTCAILDDGSVSCWGSNGAGQLGDGTYTNRNTPTQTSSLGADRTAVAITAGGSHTCAILDDGSVSCWGSNWAGQLGDGTTIDRNTPTQTSSFGEGRTAVAMTVGEDHTCAILDDGSVSCWGRNNYGRLDRKSVV